MCGVINSNKLQNKKRKGKQQSIKWVEFIGAESSGKNEDKRNYLKPTQETLSTKWLLK